MPLIFLLMLSLLNSCIELEISAPGFVQMMHDLHISEALLTATITVNLIGFCIAA